MPAPWDIIGTSYFLSRESAARYYRDYGFTRADVARKFADGEIHIGKPPVKRSEGERFRIIDNGTRYAILRPQRRS